MKLKNTFLSAVFWSLCIVSLSAKSYPINELPLYGGIQKTPEQIESDKKFIDAIKQQVGSLSKGSEAAANSGWKYYYQNDHTTAIKRFNQAWLLNENNPSAYWGMGLITAHRAESVAVYDHEKYLKEAIQLLNKARSLATKDKPRILIDLGFAEIQYAIFLKISEAKRQQSQAHFDKARYFFQVAEKIDNSLYLLYLNWSVLEFEEGKYEAAKRKLDRAKEMGYQPDPVYEKKIMQNINQ